MAITSTPYGKFIQGQTNGSHFVDFDTDTLKVALTTVTYVPNRDTHEFFSSVTNELATGGGYTAGGVTMTNKSVGFDAAGDFAYFDADDAFWAALTATFRIAVVYKSTGVAGTSPLISWVDFGANEAPAAVDFSIQWATPALGGVLKLLGV